MTVTTTTTVSGPFFPNGATTAFPFSFKVFDKSDLRVFNDISGIEVDYDPSLYSVAPSDRSGTVNFAQPPSGGRLFVALNLSFENNISFGAEEAFYAQAHNEGFDRAALRDQMLSDRVGRAFQIPFDPSAVVGQYPVVLPDGTAGFSSGTGADAGLRTDLASNAGASLLGFTALGSTTGRTLRGKLSDIINVLDHGATGDGTTDDYPAFAAAYAACPIGGTIYVPKPASSYYLSANPDFYTTFAAGTITHTVRAKYVNWQIDAGASFSGPGIGLPTGIGPQFLSQLTNPYNQTFGPNRVVDLRQNITLNGGALIGDTVELAEDFGYAVQITGTLTNGSSDITNVVVAGGGSLTQIKRGDRIVSAQAGWPVGPFNRVWSVAGSTITFGIDAGAGPASAGPTWTGATTPNVAFTIYKKQWMALEYRGINTGGPNSIDMAYGVRNDVINLTGGPANSYEIDLIALADPGAFCRGIFLTGHGDAPATLTAIDIQRAGATPWASALAVRCATVGVFLNAKNPISIDTAYFNPATGATEPVNFGVHLNNAPAILGGAFEARQITNGAPGVVLWRNTDTSPTGDFLSAYEANTGKKIAFIDVLGGGHFTTLQLNQVRTASGDGPINGYITVIGSDGSPIKLATVA